MACIGINQINIVVAERLLKLLERGVPLFVKRVIKLRDMDVSRYQFVFLPHRIRVVHDVTHLQSQAVFAEGCNEVRG